MAMSFASRIGRLSAAAMAVLFSVSLLAAPVKIMPLGDSRTAGPTARDCYRLYLDRMMSAAGYSYDFVGSQTSHNYTGSPPDSVFDHDHQGMWGGSARSLLRDPDSPNQNVGTWARAYTPDIVLAFLGTPDMLGGDSLSVKLPRTVAVIEEIIDTLRAVNPSVAILLCNLYPAYPLYFSTYRDLDSLKVRIPEIVAEKNTAASPLLFVDTWTGFPVFELVDGLHSNQAGSIRVARRWFEKLWPFFDSIPPPPSQYTVAKTAILRPAARESGVSFLSMMAGELRPWGSFTIAGRWVHPQAAGPRERVFPAIVVPAMNRPAHVAQ